MKSQKYIGNLSIYFYISAIVNVFSLIIIFYMAYKYYKSMKFSKTQTPIPQNKQPSINIKSGTQEQLNQNKKQKDSNHQKQCGNQQQSQINKAVLKKIEIEDLEYKQDVELVQNLLKTTPNYNSNQAALLQQIYLQQERSKYLQQKVQHLQGEVTNLRQKLIKLATPKSNDSRLVCNQSQQEIINLKNELQFCQKRLSQSNQTQKQLRLKIAAYQKIGEHTLNHPQFLRLRQMNSNYKTIISKMQSYLIQKHQNNNQLNISFNDL